MNRSNNYKKLLTTIVFATLSTTSVTSVAETTRVSGQRTTNPISVDCLNDSIVIDYSFTNISSEIETNNTWNYTRRSNQKGYAYDSQGNSWSFNGGYTVTEHVAYDEAVVTRFHWQNTDILVAEPGNPHGNLILTWKLRGVYDYSLGEFLVREERESVSCLKN